jgi:nucleoside-diphosphate-sugar epimerase
VQQALSYFKGKKIGLIGLGYLGKHTFRYLEKYSAEFQYEVLPFDRENLSTLKGETFDFFFNCSGNTGDFRNNIWPTVESNLFLTKYLFENIKVRECYVALSSTRLYGYSLNENILFKESDPLLNSGNHLNLDFVYDGTKMLLESILWNSGGNLDFRTSICRLSNVYGRYLESDLNDSTFLKLLVRTKVEGGMLKVNQNLLNTKGYIFIDDAIQGIINSAVYAEGTDIYNICSGESYSVDNWIKYLKIEVNTENRKEAPLFSRIDIKKATREIEFKPKYLLRNIEFDKIYCNGSDKGF